MVSSSFCLLSENVKAHSVGEWASGVAGVSGVSGYGIYGSCRVSFGYGGALEDFIVGVSFLGYRKGQTSWL